MRKNGDGEKLEKRKVKWLGRRNGKERERRKERKARASVGEGR